MKLTTILLPFVVLLSVIITRAEQKSIDQLKKEVVALESENAEKAKLLSQLATQYASLEEFTEAKKTNLQALRIFEKLKDHRNTCKVLLDLAMNYDRTSQFDEALNYSFKALDILELFKSELDTNDYKFRKGMIFMNMGIIYGQIENNAESLQRLNQAYELLEHSGELYRAICAENLGNIHLNLAAYEKALIHFEKALAYYENNHVKPILVTNTLNNMGNVHKAQNDLEKALSFYQKALMNIRHVEGHLNEKASTLNSIGDTYIELMDLKKAKLYLDSAYRLSQEHGGTRFIEENYKSYVKLYIKQGNYKKAFENLASLKSMEDSLYQPELLDKIANIKSEYDLKVEQRENAIKIELLEREKQLNLYKWYAICAIIAIILLITFFLFYRYRQKAILSKVALKNSELEKQQLSDKLHYKNNQLTNYAVYIVKKNEFLDSIKSQIEALKKGGDVNIDDLSRTVNQHINSEQDRKDFDIRVKKEKEDFYFKLDKLYPDLSEKNKKLCSLLLLDLSSKEISSLMNISVESVEKSRYRLRKKLNIPKESNISTFLNNL